jgi:hypothetical protein
VAKAKTAAAPKAKKNKKAKPSKTAALKAAPEAPRKKRTAKVKAKAGQGMDALVKLAEHPLVGELLAVGAMAAVAAIAEGGMSKKNKSKVKASTKSVRDAGKAAAAAIGKRLIAEFEPVAKAAKKAKPGA